jgi:hypothetical protein
LPVVTKMFGIVVLGSGFKGSMFSFRSATAVFMGWSKPRSAAGSVTFG